jgi:hypothetical protein
MNKITERKLYRFHSEKIITAKLNKLPNENKKLIFPS